MQKGKSTRTSNEVRKRLGMLTGARDGDATHRRLAHVERASDPSDGPDDHELLSY